MINIVCSEKEYEILNKESEKINKAILGIPDLDPRVGVILNHSSITIKENPPTNADVLLGLLMNSLEDYAETRVDYDISNNSWIGDFMGHYATEEEAIKKELGWLNELVTTKERGGILGKEESTTETN